MVFVDDSLHTAFAAKAAAPFTITEYFAKSCPHCVHLAPVWQEAKTQALSGTSAGNVDWVQKECYGDNWLPGKDFDFCAKKNVDAFPTIVLEQNGTSSSWTAPSLTGANVAQKAEQLVKFVSSHTGDNDIKQASFGIDTAIAACAIVEASPLELFRNFL